MKKLTQRIAALAGSLAMLFVVSCSDKDKDAEVVLASQPNIATTWQNNHEVISTNQLFYDDNNRLIRFVASNGDAVNIVYNRLGNIYQLTNDAGVAFEDRHYDSDEVLTNITHYQLLPSGPVPSYERVFDYNKAGQIRRVKFNALHGSAPEEAAYHTYTYNAAGLIVTDSAFKFINGFPNFYHTVSYTYDDKTGVSAFGLESNLENPPYRFYFLKHNITSKRITWANGHVTFSQMQFEYNKNGLPARRQVYADGKLISTTDFGY